MQKLWKAAGCRICRHPLRHRNMENVAVTLLQLSCLRHGLLHLLFQESDLWRALPSQAQDNGFVVLMCRDLPLSSQNLPSQCFKGLLP